MSSLADHNFDQSRLLLSLCELQKEQQMTTDCLRQKEQQVSDMDARIHKIKEAIYDKKQNNEELQLKIVREERDQQFYKDHIRYIQREIIREQTALDTKIMSRIAVKTSFQESLKQQQIAWDHLLGQKIRLILPSNIPSFKWTITNAQESLIVEKKNKGAGYTKLISLHPLPSKGRFYISFTCQANQTPSFLAGLTTKRLALTQTSYWGCPQTIFMNFFKMTFENENEILKYCPYFLQKDSSIVCLFECSFKKMIVIIDTYLAGEISLVDFGEEYLYFFTGISNHDTVLKFDHSDKIPFF